MTGLLLSILFGMSGKSARGLVPTPWKVRHSIRTLHGKLAGHVITGDFHIESPVDPADLVWPPRFFVSTSPLPPFDPRATWPEATSTSINLRLLRVDPKPHGSAKVSFSVDVGNLAGISSIMVEVQGAFDSIRVKRGEVCFLARSVTSGDLGEGPQPGSLVPITLFNRDSHGPFLDINDKYEMEAPRLANDPSPLFYWQDAGANLAPGPWWTLTSATNSTVNGEDRKYSITGVMTGLVLIHDFDVYDVGGGAYHAETSGIIRAYRNGLPTTLPALMAQRELRSPRKHHQR
jgi:hypothetical protein